MLAIRECGASFRRGRGFLTREQNHGTQTDGPGRIRHVQRLLRGRLAASNRRVPADILGGIDGDEPARKLVEEQDREISGKSGMPPLRIERIVRVDDDVKQQARDVRRAKRSARRASARDVEAARPRAMIEP